MKYDVEADWTLLTTCNFRCTYCFLSTAELGAKITTCASHTQWTEGFRATGKTWLIHLTGGEPSLYPGFVELCAALSDKHYLSINSNLSHRCMDSFAEVVDPDRVHYINASVHYGEREGHNALTSFVERVHKLKTRRFNVLVSFVMTPEMVTRFPEIDRWFDAQGLSLVPKVIRGRYQGGSYPRGYSREQKQLLRLYLVDAKKKCAATIVQMGETPTIDMFADSRFLDGIPNYRGRLCASGSAFVRIDSKGDVVRCGSGERLGNILARDVGLLNAPKKCDTSYCPYFCEKYTSPKHAPTRFETRPSFVRSIHSRVKGLSIRKRSI